MMMLMRMMVIIVIYANSSCGCGRGLTFKLSLDFRVTVLLQIGGLIILMVMMLSALSLKIWVFETLPMEKPGFFLNADIIIDLVHIKQQVLANKDASPFLRCFVVVVAVVV